MDNIIDIEISKLYEADVDELIDWEALAEFETEDIRAMIPLITARLIQLL